MIGKLIEGIKRTGAPIVVGLDPQMKFIPASVKKEAYDKYGETLEGAAESFFLFNKAIVDAVCDLVPAVKPQVAMYEALGIPGLQAFKRTVDYCHEKGLLVIGDVKRGDIGSTSLAYATAHLGSVEIGGKKVEPFGEDFATVNPYLGSDGVKPFVDVCRENNKGIFVLVKTSNPSSGEFQDREVDGKPLYELVGEKVREWGEGSMDGRYSNVGAVVGATWPEQGERLRKLMPNTFILAPGYGAQGASAKDLTMFFDEAGEGAIVNSSRGIIAAWTKDAYSEYGAEGFAQAARAAAIDMIEDLRQAIADR